jgi:dTMP kinase
VTGILIAFEGLDQSGKETQARRLAARLRRDGRDVTELTFPCYRTAVAEEISRALRGERDYRPDVLQLLFIANRYEYAPRIRTWLSEGRVVVCDRYLASSIAYGEAQGLDPAWLADVQKYLPQPDATVLIDIAPATAADRKAAGRDRFERDFGLLAAVRTSYLRQSAAAGWMRVNGEQSIDDVEAEIAGLIADRLARPSAP